MLILKKDNSIEVKLNENKLLFSGNKGNLGLIIINYVKVILKNNFIIIKSNEKKYLNLYYSLIKQKLKGVSQGYRIPLFIKGVGYKILLDGDYLQLKLGYSYLINIKIPNNIKINNSKKNIIIFSSNDLCKLTSFVHCIKKYRKPGIYKEKGLFFKEEKFFLKEIKKK